MIFQHERNKSVMSMIENGSRVSLVGQLKYFSIILGEQNERLKYFKNWRES